MSEYDLTCIDPTLIFNPVEVVSTTPPPSNTTTFPEKLKKTRRGVDPEKREKRIVLFLVS